MVVDVFYNFIGGRWTAPSTNEYEKNINPADTAEVLGGFPRSGTADVEQAIEAAEKAGSAWGKTTASERSALLYRFADLLDANADELGEILTKEQGKVLAESVGEVRRAATETRFMAGEAERLTGETIPSADPGIWIQQVREPLGVIACITPWNFPVVTPVRKIAPALACGDTVVFKPASETPWTAVRLMELLVEAGLPDGVVNLVMGPGSVVGRALAESPKVQGVTFTGSTGAGRQIYQAASEHLARIQLELGGKNPAVVYNAYDLNVAANEIVKAAFTCSGQRCTALSRVIVQRAEAQELTERIIELVDEINVGNGLKDGVSMGPLVSSAQLEQVERYVAIAKEEGAEILRGGERLSGLGNGYYYAPTIVTGVTKESRLMKEEIFGPVLPILPVDSFDEAIGVTNDVIYGLAASVFTSDLDLATKFAGEARVGMVHINHGTASQAHVPFGGVKSSGQGPYSIGSTAKDFYTVDKVVYTKGR